jgi:hypothetical protein
MGSLFSSPEPPEPKLPPPPKVEDEAIPNAEKAERLRRLRSIGKQQSIFAGEIGTSANVLRPTLGV